MPLSSKGGGYLWPSPMSIRMFYEEFLPEFINTADPHMDDLEGGGLMKDRTLCSFSSKGTDHI